MSRLGNVLQSKRRDMAIAVNVWDSPMVKNFVRHGRYTVLPVVGDTVVEVCLSVTRLPELVFEDGERARSSITFEQPIELRRGKSIHVVTPTGAKTDHANLDALVQVLGKRVDEATGDEHGVLRLRFSDGLVLTVTPRVYEGWHFRFPRRARPEAPAARPIALDGTVGGLIAWSSE